MMTGLFLFSVWIATAFVAIRNHWVYKQRRVVLNCYGEAFYDALPGYAVMLLKCWIWKVDTFVYGGKKL